MTSGASSSIAEKPVTCDNNAEFRHVAIGDDVDPDIVVGPEDNCARRHIRRQLLVVDHLAVRGPRHGPAGGAVAAIV